MPAFLNQDTADALCTMIVAGYLTLHGDKTSFQYDVAADSVAYGNVKTYLNAYGVPFNFDLSVDQSEMPYIVAKTDRAPTLAAARRLLDGYWTYLAALTGAANRLPDPPKGAYLGAFSTTSSLFIVGPSLLGLYEPRFRTPDDAAVKTAYDKAVTATQTAIGCVQEVSPLIKPANAHLELRDLNKKDYPPFPRGHLFTSYHGMIQAIVKYHTSPDPNDLVLEISLGRETSKVSSCFPCCTFMTANRTPPTSTHLGRGDNWGIPAGCSPALRREWETLVTGCYACGKDLLARAANVGAALRVLDANGAEAQIPAVFLEALTFEKSFTKRITDTLPPTTTRLQTNCFR